MSDSPPNAAAIKTANQVKDILKRRNWLLARVVRFKDKEGRTSVAASEWEHIELRNKAIKALRILHKVGVHDVGERISYLVTKLNQVPDKLFSWVRYLNQDGVERRQRRHVVEAELSLCMEHHKSARKAYLEATKKLTTHQHTINKKLSAMCSDMMGAFPPELRQMVFANLGPFESEQPILLETTNFKNEWVGMQLSNKSRGDWRYAVSVVGKQMAAELIEIVHRKNKLIVSSDAILPILMNNTNSLHGVMMQHVITKIQVDLREIDSGVDGTFKDTILSNLQTLMELKSRNISLDINIDYDKWFKALPKDIRKDRLKTEGMNMHGKKDKNVMHNKAIRRALVAMLPLLHQLMQKGFAVKLSDTTSRWSMELTANATLDEIWKHRLLRRRTLYYNLDLTPRFFDLAWEEMWWGKKENGETNFDDITKYEA